MATCAIVAYLFVICVAEFRMRENRPSVWSKRFSRADPVSFLYYKASPRMS
jgi:hypothetical protein